MKTLNYVPQDCCIGHCRDWRETKKGTLPASDHSPSCENYKTEIFKCVRMIGDKSGCIVDNMQDAKDIAGDDPEFEIVDVELTRDQFDRLPEHGGW